VGGGSRGAGAARGSDGVLRLCMCACVLVRGREVDTWIYEAVEE
jgi:hypothetical protein